jgi:hypothetical protein
MYFRGLRPRKKFDKNATSDRTFLGQTVSYVPLCMQIGPPVWSVRFVQVREKKVKYRWKMI